MNNEFFEFSPPREGRKEVLQISNDSRKIKKPPLPPKAVERSPVVWYEKEPEIITVKTPEEFMYIVQLLTGDPNHPPPQYPSTSDDDDPQPLDDRPQGILSPTPTSLPPLVSPNAFTPSPSPPPTLPPLPDQELSIFDYLEDWLEPAASSLYPIVNSPPPPPPPPPPPLPLPTPNFRIPPSPYRMLNTEIPPSFNTPLPPMFYPPDHFPHNN